MHSALLDCFGLDRFALLCLTPPPPVPRTWGALCAASEPQTRCTQHKKCSRPNRMIAVCQTYINIGVQNPETQLSGAVYDAVAVKFLRRRRRKLPCDSQKRKGSVRFGGTIEQLLPRPPHLHVLFQRNYRNVRRTSPREQDKRPA